MPHEQLIRSGAPFSQQFELRRLKDQNRHKLLITFDKKVLAKREQPFLQPSPKISPNQRRPLLSGQSDRLPRQNVRPNNLTNTPAQTQNRSARLKAELESQRPGEPTDASGAGINSAIVSTTTSHRLSHCQYADPQMLLCIKHERALT